jgi:nitroreductase
MELDECVKLRRATRSLDKTEITRGTIDALCGTARLAPSCFNNQPWRFHFAYEPEPLAKAKQALSANNQIWAASASMIVAVMGQRDSDCKMPDGRAYYQFDCGIASAFLMLKATELGLVAHPIAGYDPARYKELFSIPEPLEILTLIIVGKQAKEINPAFNEKQVESEKNRPARKEIGEFAFFNDHWKSGPA